ncbi:MAG: response regulator [Candidatus Rokuibacteriota bacterium]
MAIRVLVIDDEADIVELIRYHLEKAGMRCLVGSDGAAALRLVREHRPDLLILDLMLPGLDGLEVCRHLRRDPVTARLPIIMLTAKAEEVDRVVGLEVGADDYVVKPFSPRELVARVKAILRRAQEPAPDGARRFGDLEVDEATHHVAVKGEPVELTAKEFALLAALVRAGGRVLSREQLLEGVWGYTGAAEIESRTVDVHIRRLRMKLGLEARRIVTVKAVGYRFAPEN